MPMRADNKKPPQNSALSSQRTGKGAAQQDRNLDKIFLLNTDVKSLIKY